QQRCRELACLRVMELTATSRGGEAFPDERERNENEAHPLVQKRVKAKKAIHWHQNKDEKKLADEVAALALRHEGSGPAVLVFVRKVEDVEKVVQKLPAARARQLTGTLRGLERDRLLEDPIFRRFLPDADSSADTVYLACTSAGEVGVNISADHMACDLSTF